MTGNENRAIPAGSLLAKSLCGHDKGKVFLVIREEGDCCYLADGVHRTLEHLKRKKKKHLQMIRHLPQETARAIAGAGQDSDIVYALRLYRKEKKEDYSCQNLT